jgi:hypothetical protein
MSLYRSGAGIHSWTQLFCIAWFDVLQFHAQLPDDLLYGKRHGGRQNRWGLGGSTLPHPEAHVQTVLRAAAMGCCSTLVMPASLRARGVCGGMPSAKLAGWLAGRNP